MTTHCCRYVPKPADSTGPVPIPSLLSAKKTQKKLQAPHLYSSSLEERVTISLPSATRKQSFPSINEQSAIGDNVKKWGSIEQLQESGFNELGKDSQWSMVERGRL